MRDSACKSEERQMIKLAKKGPKGSEKILLKRRQQTRERTTSSSCEVWSRVTAMLRCRRSRRNWTSTNSSPMESRSGLKTSPLRCASDNFW